MNNKDIALRVKGLSLTLGNGNEEKTLISRSEVDFVVGKGETVLLLGSNGSGKTTLMEQLFSVQNSERKIRDHFRPHISFDSIVFDGSENEMSLQEWNKKNVSSEIAYAPDEIESSWNDWKIDSLLKTQSEPYRKYDKKEFKNYSKELFEYFYDCEYKEIRKKKIGKFSGGQKKRYVTIKAFVRKNAPLMVFDEPLNCLDIDNIRKFARKIDELKKCDNCNTGFIIITHCRVLKNVDRVYKISDGRLCDYTQDYIEESKNIHCIDF